MPKSPKYYREKLQESLFQILKTAQSNPEQFGDNSFLSIYDISGFPIRAYGFFSHLNDQLGMRVYAWSRVSDDFTSRWGKWLDDKRTMNARGEGDVNRQPRYDQNFNDKNDLMKKPLDTSNEGYWPHNRNMTDNDVFMNEAPYLWDTYVKEHPLLTQWYTGGKEMDWFKLAQKNFSESDAQEWIKNNKSLINILINKLISIAGVDDPMYKSQLGKEIVPIQISIQNLKNYRTSCGGGDKLCFTSEVIDFLAKSAVQFVIAIVFMDNNEISSIGIPIEARLVDKFINLISENDGSLVEMDSYQEWILLGSE